MQAKRCDDDLAMQGKVIASKPIPARQCKVAYTIASKAGKFI
jgi:hypothetical protein